MSVEIDPSDPMRHQVGFFPLLIKILEGENEGLYQVICHHEIPVGVSFKVIETNVDQKSFLEAFRLGTMIGSKETEIKMRLNEMEAQIRRDLGV